MNKLLIVHGYSDKSESFTELANLLRRENLYHDIRYIDYDSVDDQATFHDYADRLNDIYEQEYPNERIDILCHSTGSLVVRAWLALRRQRQLRQAAPLDVPVERLYMFAPANFGSDMATLGQSFWNRMRRFATTGKEDSKDGDAPWEVGKKVLQGLEPASPDQWFLSQFDLHGEKAEGYFGLPHGTNGQCCYPFVFAAGRVEPFFGDRIISTAIKAGTDTTVRICGTSLNTRKCVLSPKEHKLVDDHPLQLDIGNKASKIPFVVFYDLNHTSLVGGRLNPGNILSKDRKQLDRSWSPLRLLKQAQQVNSLDDYQSVADEFDRVNEANHAAWAEPNEDLKQDFDAATIQKLTARCQQIFFRFVDDVDDEVSDIFIDFYVYDANDNKDVGLTRELDKIFLLENEFYAHSINKSHRVLFFNYDRWAYFQKKLQAENAKVILEIDAEPDNRCVLYERCRKVIYNPNWTAEQQDGNLFFYPNTTTLVQVMLNRKQRFGLLEHQIRRQP
jgi:hypothetical protein